MKMILTKHWKTVSLFAFISLTSCTTNQNTIQGQVIQASPYKRTIEITVDHPQLKSLLEQKIIKKRQFILQPTTGFSEFHITVQSRLNRIKSLETKPLLLGRIQKTKTPVNYQAHYKINNHTNLTLAEGYFSETTETTSRVYPSLTLTANIQADAINSLADKILAEARTHILVTPWSARVTAQKDEQHITLSVGEEAGLELGDTFITESQPTAKLQVVMFEQIPSGNNRAVLGLLEGFLPEPGRKLIAEK